MKYNYVYFIALAFSIFSCEESKSKISSLEESQEKWNSHSLKSYRMNLNIVCNCIPTPDIDIRVDDGKISLIIYSSYFKSAMSNFQSYESSIVIKS